MAYAGGMRGAAVDCAEQATGLRIEDELGETARYAGRQPFGRGFGGPASAESLKPQGEEPAE